MGKYERKGIARDVSATGVGIREEREQNKNEIRTKNGSFKGE